MSRTIRNTGDLDLAAAAGLATLFPKRLKIIVGSASCGVAMGARAVEAAAIRAVERTRFGRRRLPHRLYRFLRKGTAFGSRAAKQAEIKLRQHDAGKNPAACSKLMPPKAT